MGGGGGLRRAHSKGGGKWEESKANTFQATHINWKRNLCILGQWFRPYFRSNLLFKIKY